MAVIKDSLGTITIVSTVTDGTAGNAASGGLAGSESFDGADSFDVSPDGSKIAFVSVATNLANVSNDGGYPDIFVKDLKTGVTTLVSTLAGSKVGRNAQPTFSPDGSRVAFTTFGVADPGGIYVKDLITGGITLVSTDAAGARINYEVTDPVFAPDGKSIAFATSAKLAGSADGRATNIYLKDLTNGAITLVSSTGTGLAGVGTGAFGTGNSFSPVFSQDGTKVAFTSEALNFFPDGTSRPTTDIYVKDLATGILTLASTSASGTRGTPNADYTLFDNSNPTFSPDGTKLAFQSFTRNLVPGDDDDASDIFVKDLTTGAISRLIVPDDQTIASPKDAFGPAFSPDGTKIAFWADSAFPGAGLGGTTHSRNVYIKDLVSGTVTLVTTDAFDRQDDGSSFDPKFSADGHELVFWSDSANLVANDANGHIADIFVDTFSNAPANAAPVGLADSYNTLEGTPLVVAAATGLLANDTDAENDALSAALVAGPSHGELTLAPDGSFTYTPAASYAGGDGFTYTASDGSATSQPTTVSLAITQADRPVTAADDVYNTPTGTRLNTPAATGVLANDAAPDAGLAVLGLVVNGALVPVDPTTGYALAQDGTSHSYFELRADGSFTYIPFASFAGTDTFTYRITDADGSMADATVTLRAGLGTGQPVTADDDTYYAPTGATITVPTATGLLANDAAPDGGLRVLGFVIDGSLVKIDSVFGYDVQTTPSGGKVTLRPDGSIAYVPGSATFAGSETLTYRITDTDGSTADATVTFKSGVGTGQPVTAADDTYFTATGTRLNTPATTGVLANDAAPDGGLAVLGLVVNGTLIPVDPKTGYALVQDGTSHSYFELRADGSFNYIPFASFAGTDTFTYRITDADGSTADTTVTLNAGLGTGQPVTATNDTYADPPGAELLVPAATGLLANDAAPDGGLRVLGFVIDGSLVKIDSVFGYDVQTTPSGGKATIRPDGSIDYVPVNATFMGTDTLTYRITDTDGSTADATVTFKLGPVDLNPVDAVDDSFAVSNALPEADFSANVLTNDVAPDGGLVALGIVVDGVVQTGFVKTAAGGQAILASDGQLTYDQPFRSDDQGVIRYNGVDSLTYRVRDADGSTDDATVTLTVGGGVDNPVVATDDSYAVSSAFLGADFTTNIATGVLANDFALDSGLVALGILVGGVVQTGFVQTAAGGQAEILADGRLVYNQPFTSDDQGLISYNGIDSFTYRVRDADGSTADATVTLTVGGGVNHPVVATDDSYAVSNEFPSTDFTTDIATGVLANDFALDGGLVALGIVVGGAVQTGFVKTAAGGQAKLASDGRLIYDQPFSSDDQGLISYNGTDSFTYRVRDADGSTDDATVTLTVGGGVNHPVTATDDSYAVFNEFPSTDFATNITTGVLANDFALDGGLVALGIVVGGVVQTGFVKTPAGGQAKVLADGRLVYDQPFTSDDQGVIRYNGTDSFTYRVRDADGSTADATVTLTVGSGSNPRTVTRNPDGSVHDIAYAGVTGKPYTSYDVVYGPNGKPATATYSDGSSAAFNYGPDGTLSDIAYAGLKGSYASYDAAYGAEGKQVSASFSNGNQARFDYASDGSLLDIVNTYPSGRYVSSTTGYGVGGKAVVKEYATASGNAVARGLADGLTFATSPVTITVTEPGGRAFAFDTPADVLLTGGGQHETFAFGEGFGHDTITDFRPTAISPAGHDTIAFAAGAFADYVDLLSHTAQAGSGTLITTPVGDTLTLLHVAQGSLSAADFRFG